MSNHNPCLVYRAIKSQENPTSPYIPWEQLPRKMQQKYINIAKALSFLEEQETINRIHRIEKDKKRLQ